jgi:hypothetical protein
VATLDALCTVLRAKNAGPFYTTIDIFFADDDAYRRVVDGGLLTPAVVAQRYGLERDEVYGIFSDARALCLKVTIRKRLPTDSPANTDIAATQQHLPLAGLEIPV